MPNHHQLTTISWTKWKIVTDIFVDAHYMHAKYSGLDFPEEEVTIALIDSIRPTEIQTRIRK